jgi:transcriptional regulator with XRE-family HTH domain
MKTTANRSRLGATLRVLRTQKGWTLSEVSRRTGFSVPTLSKVENDRLSLSYDKLIRLSEGLGVGIEQLFSPIVDGHALSTAVTGRRSVNRQGDGELVSTRNYDYWYLNADVTRKKFIPIMTEVHAKSLEEFGDLVKHGGEEFIFVLEGQLEVHTELYSPLVLAAGDSAYLDSAMGHAYVKRGDGPCRIIGVCSASESHLREVAQSSPPREAPPPRAKTAPAKSAPAKPAPTKVRKPSKHR